MCVGVWACVCVFMCSNNNQGKRPSLRGKGRAEKRLEEEIMGSMGGRKGKERSDLIIFNCM